MFCDVMWFEISLQRCGDPVQLVCAGAGWQSAGGFVCVDAWMAVEPIPRCSPWCDGMPCTCTKEAAGFMSVLEEGAVEALVALQLLLKPAFELGCAHGVCIMCHAAWCKVGKCCS